MADRDRAPDLGPVGQLLTERMAAHTIRVTVIGAGYVGLPLAVELGRSGFAVCCVDVDPKRVAMINVGQSYIADVKETELASLVQAGKVQASTSFDGLGSADVIVICVPTPLTPTKDPEISAVVDAARHVAAHLRPGQLISLESTTYPGTVEEVVLPLLSGTGLQVGVDFFLCHSPERVDPGNASVTTGNTNKVVGGVTPACLAVASAFYAQVVPRVVPVSSPRAAEVTKLFENTYRAVNIALVNEFAMLCERMKLDVWEVVEAASTKGFGFQAFWPGPGVGGHCIALDPFYLAWKAREYDFSTRFIELASEINLRMPHYVKERLVRLLSEDGKPLRGARILVVGVAYKRDVPDARESPALKLVQILRREGANVCYHDPYLPEVRPMGEDATSMQSVVPTDDLLQSTDAVVITTDHSNVDYAAICRKARIVLDTRNATKDLRASTARIVKL